MPRGRMLSSDEIEEIEQAESGLKASVKGDDYKAIRAAIERAGQGDAAVCGVDDGHGGLGRDEGQDDGVCGRESWVRGLRRRIRLRRRRLIIQRSRRR